MIPGLESLAAGLARPFVEGATSIAKKYITDRDKYIEFQAEIEKLKTDFFKTVVEKLGDFLKEREVTERTQIENLAKVRLAEQQGNFIQTAYRPIVIGIFALIDVMLIYYMLYGRVYHLIEYPNIELLPYDICLTLIGIVTNVVMLGLGLRSVFDKFLAPGIIRVAENTDLAFKKTKNKGSNNES